MIPNKLIVLYKTGSSRNKSVYIEHGKFMKKGESYIPTGMQPFSMEELKKFFSISQTSEGIYMDTIAPKNLLFYKNNGFSSTIIWSLKKDVRKLAFFDQKLTKEYLIPNLIFVAKNSDLYVYFIKNKDAENINEETLLYQTHFLNVYQDCKVCIGNGYRPNMDSTPLSQFMKKAEFNFFEGSTFNVSHVGDWPLNIWKNKNGIFPEKQWDKKKARTLKSLLR